MIHVSVDGGEVWNMAQLPTVNHEQFYSILAANQDMIFMHVDDPEGQKQWRCWEWWWVLMMDMVTTLHADADNYIHFIKVSLIDTNTGAAESFNGLNGLYCVCVCVQIQGSEQSMCQMTEEPCSQSLWSAISTLPQEATLTSRPLPHSGASTWPAYSQKVGQHTVRYAFHILKINWLFFLII